MPICSISIVDKRLLLFAAIALLAVVFILLTGDESSPGDSTLAVTSTASSSASPTTVAAPTTTVDAAEAASAVVAQYWAYLSGDPTQVASILDLPPTAMSREVGLAEYSAAYGGTYLADCEAGVVVAGEVVVDCLVDLVDEPLAAAFAIGPTPTQFRVRDGKISQVGYLKPYSTVDLALSAHAARTDQEGFEAACSDPEGIYQSEAGVVYNGTCGAYMAALVGSVLARVREAEACGDDCDAALLSAIRPSKD